MLFTLGLGGVWALIDFFRILFGNFTDKEGLPIVQGGSDSRNNSSSTRYGTAQPRNGVGMWVLGGVVVLVVLGGAGYALREGGLSSGDAQRTSGAEDKALPTVGDVVRVGDFDVRIDAVQPKDSVGMIFGGESAPQGTVYVVVNYSYTNRSAEPKEFFEKPSVVLVDASGRKMASDGGARALVGADQDFSAGLMNAINPGVTHDDGEVFQVSREAFDATTWTVRIEVDWHSQVVVLARVQARPEADTPKTVSRELPPPPHAPPSYANQTADATGDDIASNFDINRLDQPTAEPEADARVSGRSDRSNATAVTIAIAPKVGSRFRMPEYPALSRRAGEAGEVLVSACVDADGISSNPAIVKSSGSQRLDDATIAAFTNNRLEPAVGSDGKPIAVCDPQPYVFSFVWSLKASP